MNKIKTYNNISKQPRLAWQHMLWLMLLCWGAMHTAQAQQTVSFGGHVFSDNLPIEKGYAYLYKYDDMSSVFQVAKIDTLGYYYFYDMPQDKYIVYAGLSIEDPNFGQFAYTYYPQAALWQQSTPLVPNVDTWDYHIHLINQDPEQMPMGPGQIAGTVDNSMGQLVDVILFDKDSKKVIRHLPVEANGSFAFSHLPVGDYVLYPQVIGLPTVSKPISLTASSYDMQNLQIQVGEHVGFVGLPETQGSKAYVLEYYSRQGQQMVLQLRSPMQKILYYSLYSTAGQLLAQGQWQAEEGSHTYHMALPSLAASAVVVLQLSDAYQPLLSAKCSL